MATDTDTPTPAPDIPAAVHDHIVRLETRIAYQDHLLASLDEVVREFSARVESLERRLRMLEGSLGSLDTGPADEPPPHY